jgi:hypothetical protein
VHLSSHFILLCELAFGKKDCSFMNVSLGNDYSQPALNDPCPMLVTSFYTPLRMFIVEQQLEQRTQKERVQ